MIRRAVLTSSLLFVPSLLGIITRTTRKPGMNGFESDALSTKLTRMILNDPSNISALLFIAESCRVETSCAPAGWLPGQDGFLCRQANALHSSQFGRGRYTPLMISNKGKADAPCFYGFRSQIGCLHCRGNHPENSNQNFYHWSLSFFFIVSDIMLLIPP